MTTDTPDTSNAAIGARLVAVRAARGWNQSTMARAMELGTQRWGGYERGRVVPPPEVLGRFWQITGATADYILFGRLYGMPHELVEAIRALERPDGATDHDDTTQKGA